MCWNWQTRRTQNPLVVTPCGFDPHHRHTKSPREPKFPGAFCIAVVRGRTGRRAAARNQQSGGLLVSPRETPSAGKETRKDAGERGGAALARRIVGRLIKTLESFFASRPGGPCRNNKKDVQRFVTPHVRESFYFRQLCLFADFNCSVCFDKISDIEDCEVEIIFVFIFYITCYLSSVTCRLVSWEVFIYNSIDVRVPSLKYVINLLLIFLSH